MAFVYKSPRYLTSPKDIQLPYLFNIILDRISLLKLEKFLVIPCEL